MAHSESQPQPVEPAKTAFRATIRLPGGVSVEVEAPDAEGLQEVVAGLARVGPLGRAGGGSPGPTRWPSRPSHDELARAWNEVVEAGEAPRPALSERYGVSVRAISRWAAEARQAGADIPVRLGPPKRKREGST
jgi:hypothetical protein